MYKSMENLLKSEIAYQNIGLINQIGHEMGVSQRVIDTAVQIANIESNLGTIHKNMQGSAARGIFQYMSDENIGSWKTGLTRLYDDAKAGKIFLSEQDFKFLKEMRNNPDLADQIRQSTNPEWQIKATLASFRRYEDGYDEGIIYIKGDYSQAYAILEQSGFNPRNNFLDYAYTRHNADISNIVKYPNEIKDQIRPKLQNLKDNQEFVEKLNDLSDKAGEKYRNTLNTKPLTVKDIAAQYTGHNSKEITQLYIKHNYINPNHFNLPESTLKVGYGSHHHMELTHQIYDLQPLEHKDINLAAYQAIELIENDSLSYLHGQSEFQGFPIINAQAKSTMIDEVDTIVEKLDVKETTDISIAINGLNKTLSFVHLTYDDLKNHMNEGIKIQDIPEIKAYDQAKNPQKQNILTKLFSSPKPTPTSDYTDRIIRRYNQIEKSIEAKKQILADKTDHFKNEISNINMSDETSKIIHNVNTGSSTYLQGHLNMSLLSKMQENPEQILMDFNASQNSIVKASSYLLPSGSQQKTVDGFLEQSNQPLSNTIKENLSRVTSDLPQTQTSLNQSLQSVSQSPTLMVHEYEQR